MSMHVFTGIIFSDGVHTRQYVLRLTVTVGNHIRYFAPSFIMFFHLRYDGFVSRHGIITEQLVRSCSKHRLTFEPFVIISLFHRNDRHRLGMKYQSRLNEAMFFLALGRVIMSSLSWFFYYYLTRANKVR